MARILIVEDEPDIVLALKEDLGRQGHFAEAATDGEQGLRLGAQGNWDLILLDIMLPKMDGFDVCSELRRAGVSAPIIMLTARAQEAEKVLGLDAGADDYVTKPFSLRELRARIRAQLRRMVREAGVNPETRIEVEDVETAVELVGRGLADTIVGKGVVTEVVDRLAPGAHWVSLEPRQYGTLAIVHRAGATLSPAAQVMVHLATRRIQEVLEPIRPADRRGRARRR